MATERVDHSTDNNRRVERPASAHRSALADNRVPVQDHRMNTSLLTRPGSPKSSAGSPKSSEGGPNGPARPVRPSGGRRKLSPAMATALVVGNMVGSGVFLLPVSLAAYGTASLVAWGFTAAGSMLLALVFSRLGRTYLLSGGPYLYSRRAFGDAIGFQAAWGYWIAIWAGNAAIAIAGVAYLGEFWGVLDTTGPDGNKLVAAVVALGAIWLLTWVNSIGVRSGGWVQTATTVAKLVPLIGIATLGLFFMEVDNFGPFNPTKGSAFNAITAAATLTLWAFIGLESATVPAEDVDEPERTIPRATVVGTAIATLVYLLGTVAVMGIVGNTDLLTSNAPFADAARIMFGSWAARLVSIGAVISAFGCLNGWILLQGQIPLAAARDGLFPSLFARVSRRGVPVVGMLVSSLLVTGLMFMNYTKSLSDQFTFVILLATLTTLVPYAYSAAGQLMLLITDRERFEGGRLVRHSLIASLALAYSLWAIAGSGYQVVFRGFMLLLAGWPVYILITWQHSRTHSTDPDEEAPSQGERVVDLTDRSEVGV